MGLSLLTIVVCVACVASGLVSAADAVLAPRVSDMPADWCCCTAGGEEEGCGEDSDGGSEFGLDSDRDEDEDEEEQESEEGSGGGPKAAGNKAKAGGGSLAAGQPHGGKAAGSGQSGAVGTEEEQAAVLGEAVGRCGHVGLRELRGCMRGLPGRLRFLRRVGLLPTANVFKVFQPTAEGAR